MPARHSQTAAQVRVTYVLLFFADIRGCASEVTMDLVPLPKRRGLSQDAEGGAEVVARLTGDHLFFGTLCRTQDASSTQAAVMKESGLSVVVANTSSVSVARTSADNMLHEASYLFALTPLPRDVFRQKVQSALCHSARWPRAVPRP